MAKEQKLTLAPIEPEAAKTNPMLAGMTVEKMPENLEKLTLPPMLDLKTVTVGTVFSGRIIKMVENFTGKADMRKARLMHLQHSSGMEFLLPLTGVIRNAFKDYIKVGKDDTETISPELVGKTAYFQRLPDGSAKKYGGTRMFQFDIRLAAK